jgi:hypothetical protein
MKRGTLIKKLIKFGHTPFKALEIAIDYERNQSNAVNWVRHLLSME